MPVRHRFHIRDGSRGDNHARADVEAPLSDAHRAHAQSWIWVSRKLLCALVAVAVLAALLSASVWSSLSLSPLQLPLGVFLGLPRPLANDEYGDLPPQCRRFFDPSFPINLTRAIETHLGRAEDRPPSGDDRRRYSFDRIARPLCDAERPHATVLLWRGEESALYVRGKIPTFEEVPKRYRLENVVDVFRWQVRQFGDGGLTSGGRSHGVPDVLFKWWSLDNPVSPCHKFTAEAAAGRSAQPGPPDAAAVGVVGYSRCPPPYCQSSIVVPVSSAMNEAKEGRLDLRGTLNRAVASCGASRPFEARRPPRAEWHGIPSGHVPMPFWDAPSEFFAANGGGTGGEVLPGGPAPTMAEPNRRTHRSQLVKTFAAPSSSAPDGDGIGGGRGSALPVVATYNKTDLCPLLGNNRLLFSIGGYSYASNFFDNMLSGAVTYKQDFPAWSYFEPFFEPREHYVLGRRDIGDVRSVVEKVLGPGGPSAESSFERQEEQRTTFARMAAAARKRAILLAEESPLLQTCFYNQLFREYSRMLEPEATSFDPDEWVRFTTTNFGTRWRGVSAGWKGANDTSKG